MYERRYSPLNTSLNCKILRFWRSHNVKNLEFFIRGDEMNTPLYISVKTGLPFLGIAPHPNV